MGQVKVFENRGDDSLTKSYDRSRAAILKIVTKPKFRTKIVKIVKISIQNRKILLLSVIFSTAQGLSMWILVPSAPAPLTSSPPLKSL